MRPREERAGVSRARLGENVLRVSRRRGMSQRELAHVAGLSEPHVSMIVNGHYDLTVSTLMRLCYALECKPDDLLEGVVSE